MVFGEVVSGQEIITHIEGLPVDRMSRPLQDAKVVNCGELVLKIKSKGIIVFYFSNIESQIHYIYVVICICLQRKNEKRSKVVRWTQSLTLMPTSRRRKRKTRKGM